MSSGGAEYTFNEIAGEWDRTDLTNTLDEVVITAGDFDNSHAGDYDDRAGVDQREEYSGDEYELYSSLDVMRSVVKPTPDNLLNVVSNTLTVAEGLRESKIGDFIRNGRPPVNGISSILKTTGNVLGGIGIGVTAYQYSSGQITGTEASVDAFMGAVAFLGHGEQR